MVIAYEFPNAHSNDCNKLVDFSRKIIAYGGRDIPKIVVKCCDKNFYFKAS